MARIDERNMRIAKEEDGDYLIPAHQIDGRIIGAIIGAALCSSVGFVNPVAIFLCRAGVGMTGGTLGKEITTLNNQEYFDELQTDVDNLSIGYEI